MNENVLTMDQIMETIIMYSKEDIGILCDMIESIMYERKQKEEAEETLRRC